MLRNPTTYAAAAILTFGVGAVLAVHALTRPAGRAASVRTDELQAEPPPAPQPLAPVTVESEAPEIGSPHSPALPPEPSATQARRDERVEAAAPLSSRDDRVEALESVRRQRLSRSMEFLKRRAARARP